MANELVKRFIKKDGALRISFYREEYADNPRDMTDEPLHCEDWSSDYSIMNKHEREYRHPNARTLICRLLLEYGKREKIIDRLIENGKHLTDGKCIGDDALVYCRFEKKWNLMMHYKKGWYIVNSYECSKDYLDLCEILEDLCDETINELCYFKYWNDGVKTASYSFDYDGGISFSDEISCDSEGICWLEKDEFLKYSGHNEEYWNSKSLDEIEFLLDELKAWSDNDVYGFVVEDAVRIQGMKIYYNGEREDEPFIDTQWEESDSCWGFYGELDKMIPYMFEQTNLKQEDLEELR